MCEFGWMTAMMLNKVARAGLIVSYFSTMVGWILLTSDNVRMGWNHQPAKRPCPTYPWPMLHWSVSLHPADLFSQQTDACVLIAQGFIFYPQSIPSLGWRESTWLKDLLGRSEVGTIRPEKCGRAGRSRHRPRPRRSSGRSAVSGNSQGRRKAVPSTYSNWAYKTRWIPQNHWFCCRYTWTYWWYNMIYSFDPDCEILRVFDVATIHVEFCCIQGLLTDTRGGGIIEQLVSYPIDFHSNLARKSLWTGPCWMFRKNPRRPWEWHRSFSDAWWYSDSPPCRAVSCCVSYWIGFVSFKYNQRHGFLHLHRAWFSSTRLISHTQR